MVDGNQLHLLLVELEQFTHMKVCLKNTENTGYFGSIMYRFAAHIETIIMIRKRVLRTGSEFQFSRRGLLGMRLIMESMGGGTVALRLLS